MKVILVNGSPHKKFLSPAELYQMPIKARAASPQNELN